MKHALLNQVYANSRKVDGVDHKDPQAAQKIWEQYTETFRKGVYDFIKEEYDPVKKDTIPRRYFSGGATLLDSMAGEDYADLTAEDLAEIQASDESLLVVDSIFRTLGTDEALLLADRGQAKAVQDVGDESGDEAIISSIMSSKFGQTLKAALFSAAVCTSGCSFSPNEMGLATRDRVSENPNEVYIYGHIHSGSIGEVKSRLETLRHTIESDEWPNEQDKIDYINSQLENLRNFEDLDQVDKSYTLGVPGVA